MRISDWSSDVCSSDLQLLTIGGAAPVAGSYDRRSTVNGCLISSPTVCATVALDVDNNFPVQDVIEEIDGDEDSAGEGNTLPQPLITMREVDPLTGAPLLDDPVTGARSEDHTSEHTSELQSLMRISYAVFCLKKKKKTMTYKHASRTPKT